MSLSNIPQDVNEWVQQNAGSNSFAGSLLKDIEKYGYLSERQVAAVQRNLRAPAAPSKLMTRIVDVMLTAKQNLKYPKLRIERDNKYIVLSVAGERSKYTDSIMLTDGGPFGDNEYYGRISPNGQVHLGRDADSAIVNVLEALDADPAKVISDSGHTNGQCSCCGRELTNPESVELGIGPVCAGRWGVK